MDLAESLENFHITSPEKVNTVKRSNGNFEDFINSDDFEDQNEQPGIAIERPTLEKVQLKKTKKAELKPYKENENPLPQQFGSFLSKMDDWSVNYGTVKALKEDSKTNGTMAQRLNYLDEGNDAPQAQWKNYLLKPKQKSDQSAKDVSDLIVTASLSDLSLIPADTFKKKERNDLSSLSHETDPAREAKSVFKNVLKNQRSNYFRDNDTLTTQNTKNSNGANQPYQTRNYINSDFESGSRPVSGSEDFESGSDSSSDSLSELNPSNLNSPSPKPRIVTNTRRLPLITPEDAGLVFDHETGLWDKQRMIAAADSNISENSTSSFVMEEDSTTTNSNSNSHSSLKPISDSFKRDPTLDNCIDTQIPVIATANSEIESGLDDEYLGSNVTLNTVTDDTPLSTPKFNRNFYQKDTDKPMTRYPSSSLHKELSNIHSQGTANIADITSISRMDTSYDLTKREIVSRLLEIEPNPTNWQTLYEVDLSDQAIKDSCTGIDELLPNLINLDVSNNELISLQGIPNHIQSLNISNNKLRSQLLQFQDLPHVEHLDLSDNNLSALQDLRFTAPLSHLHYVDVSNCGIVSLMGLPKFAKVDTIIAKDNKLIGSIDFKQLCETSPIPWQHVTKLDLSNNRITNLKNLHYLVSLRVLILDGNSIEQLHSGSYHQGSRSRVGKKIEVGNPELRYLSIKDGGVPVHSFSGFPNLRILRITVAMDSINIEENAIDSHMTNNNNSDIESPNYNASLIPLSERFPMSFPLEQLEILGMPHSSPRQPSKRMFGTSTNGRKQKLGSDPNSSSAWEGFEFPPQLRRVTLRSLGLTRVPQTLTNNTGLSSLDMQGNNIYSAQILLPSLPCNLLRLNILQNPVLEEPLRGTDKINTGSGTNHDLVVHQRRNKDLLRLLLHWCPALVECDLCTEG